MPQSLANFLGGATSGCISTLLLQPLDVVKTRIQVSPRDFALTPISATAAVSNPATATATVSHPNIPTTTTTTALPTAPSTSTTTPTANANSPFHSPRLPSLQQQRPSHHYPRHPGIILTMRTIMQNDSPLGLWRGVTPTIFRNTLGVGAYFVTLNNLSAMLARPDGTLSDRSTLIVGACSRSISVTALCPLSVVKTRLELAEYAAVYNGVGDALVKIAKTEGIRGLFSGLTPAIVRDAPYSALYLLLFLRIKEAMNTALGLKSNSSRILKTSAAAAARPISPSPALPDASTHTTAAPPQSTAQASAGATTMSSQPKPSTSDSSPAHGAASSLSGPPSGTGTSSPATVEPIYAKQLGMAVNFTAGAIGGGLATLLTQPQDVVKTRMQAYSRASKVMLGNVNAAQYRTVGQTVRTIMLEEGIYGFFRGASPRFLKRMLGSAVTWMIFEEVVSIYDRMLTKKALMDADDNANPGEMHKS